MTEELLPFFVITHVPGADGGRLPTSRLRRSRA
jgi:hypothetical protein